MEMLAKITF